MWSHTPLFLAFISLIDWFYFGMVNSIKSHPPRSLCGLLKTGGGEDGEWDVRGEKDYRGCKTFFHNMFVSRAVEKHVAPSEATTFRLWFCMHAAAQRYFTSFLLPKMTPIRHRLHKQTPGICIISHVLVSYRERDGDPPITTNERHLKNVFPLICFGNMPFFSFSFNVFWLSFKKTEHYNHKLLLQPQLWESWNIVCVCFKTR